MPTRKINTKYYSFSQNNIQGTYIIREDIGINEITVIESTDYDSAFYKYKKIIENNDLFHSDYCDCCGFRWIQEDDLSLDGYNNLKFLEHNIHFDCSIIYFDNRIVSIKKGCRRL